MGDYHAAFTILGSIIGIISYIPYFRDILSGRTKPHPFSWFVWSLLTGTIFFAQVLNGGGVGAWISGITLIACLAITVLAFKRVEKNITTLDWSCLAAGIAGIGLWILTSQALIAVIIVTITDVIMYIPTARKSYWKPYEETLSTWILNTFKWFFSIFGLQTLSLTTALFPAGLVLANIFLITMLVIRRRRISETSPSGASGL